ncbi:uncharacterized protein LOC113498454 [Trichoplusia ni]|uniref:Uncharacterized protein LOC113498453 n=1 Tax=Trichoplusia ni TaxID=7111 RepID=A0A7E5W0V6_TRINI|nr:uncharacterized protein LOC113498453 [Trichoplusia ni]XP_026734248.1 uncharacterized protein LOC113498454 [Trichoplusia ni]
MLQKITLACLLVASVYGAGLWNPDLRTTFGLNPLGIGSSQFIPKAKSIDEAISMNWVKRDRPAGPAGLESLELWCPADDCSFCSLFDDTGYIAGVQIGVSKSRMSDWVFDPAVTGFTSWTTTINGQTAEFYTIQLYFISAEILATKKEDRLASRNKDLLIQHGYVWMTAFNGELYALSTDTSLLGTSQSEFTTQACVLWMGQHYYHKMSKTTPCAGDTLFPWFALMDSDQLIGLGFMTFGKYTVDSNVQDLFEHPDESAVKMIVSDGPQCLYDLTRTRGVLTMHVYFIDTPQLVGCPIFG